MTAARLILWTLLLCLALVASGLVMAAPEDSKTVDLVYRQF